MAEIAGKMSLQTILGSPNLQLLSGVKTSKLYSMGIQENQYNVGILLFNEVEVMDFAGPFEVFSVTTQNGVKLFNVKTIGTSKSPVRARNGLQVIPEFQLNQAPKTDILIVPGGYGAEHLEIKNTETISWIKSQQNEVEILASVCTGAFLLAEAGLLNGKRATTHWMDYDRLENEYPEVEVVRDLRFVDEGQIITSGGISAGIDMSFHIIERLFGAEVVRQTAKRMEYRIESTNG